MDYTIKYSEKIDENTTVNYDDKALDQISKDVTDIKEITCMMSDLLDKQNEHIDIVDNNMDSAKNYVDKGMVEMKKANKFSKVKFLKKSGKLIVPTAAGGVAFGPIGAGVGFVIGSLANIF